VYASSPDAFSVGHRSFCLAYRAYTFCGEIMTLLVVGSMAFDSLETPFGKRDQALGGSANYFSLCASFFSDVKLVAVVGDDFPSDHVDFLKSRNVDTEGLIRASGKTFHWTGKYGYDLNEAQTLDTQLNVFADFDPTLPESYRKADTVFLANIDPELQLKVLEQVENRKLVAMDSMNFWIQGKREALMETIRHVDVMFLNDAEARQLSGEHNIVKAARGIQKMGASTVVVKRGEYGALYFGPEQIFFTPAFPLENVYDPTGAGDTFAGGFLGWADRHGATLDANLARQNMVMGTVMASYVVEDFSFDRMRTLSHADIQQRWQSIVELTDFHRGIELG
jgi:sugar/nucleoside kinase (ribokinase family)